MVDVLAFIGRNDTFYLQHCSTREKQMSDIYYVIHLTETDGDVKIKKCYSEEDVKYYVEGRQLHKEDYSIIHGGEMIKEAA